MRTMYDSIKVANLPHDATMVAGYVGGAWPTFLTLAATFPDATRVSIAVSASHDAQVLDVERGDALPAQAPAWCARQVSRGQTPTVYCSTSMWPGVKAAFAATGQPLPLWWEAHYDGRPTLTPGAIAKQYINGPAYDTSVVADYWPGIDPPTPTPGGSTVPYIVKNIAGDDMWLIDANTRVHIIDPSPDLNAFTARFGAALLIDAAQIEAFPIAT